MSTKPPKFTFKGREFIARCIKVYDGDTCTLAFSPWSGVQEYSFGCRMLGYNSAEIKSTDPKEKEKAIESRDFLASLIMNKAVKIICGDFDLYGRILIDLYVDNKHINQLMMEHGYGKEYYGRGPKNW